MKLSVILPVYNRANSVGSALASVLGQSRPPDEVIVVDDGSVDDLATALVPYTRGISLIRQANAGAAAARNTGAARAKGDWLTFQDSDDLWPPDHLAIVARDLGNASNDIVAHIGNVTFVGAGYRQDLFAIKRRSFPTDRAERVEATLPLVISGMTLQGSAIRRDVFARLGGFDETMRIYEDTSLFCELSLQGPFLVTGANLAEVRRLEGDQTSLTSLESTDLLYSRQMHVRALEKLLPLRLSAEQSLCVNQHLAGAEFRLAQVVGRTDPAAARRILVRAARRHPRPMVGWTKAAIASVLGERGYALVLNRYKSLDRS